MRGLRLLVLACGMWDWAFGLRRLGGRGLLQPSARAWNSGRAWPGEYGCSVRTYSCLHANAAHLRVLHPRSACCVALWSCVFGCFERVVSYVGLRQHSRVSKLNDTCRNKWRRWCAGRVNCNQVPRSIYGAQPSLNRNVTGLLNVGTG